MKKKKLIISSVNLDYGGIEKSLVNLLNFINLEKYDITLVLEEKKGVFLNDLNKKIKILEYKPSSNKLINLFNRFKWLIKHYNKYDVSICYATYSLPANFIARVSAKKRIFYIHSNYYEIYNHDDNKIKSFFDNRYLSKYNKFVFVSNESKNELVKFYPSIMNKSEVINNICDVNNVLQLSKEPCNKELNNKYVGVFIGRLEEDSKQISRIIKLAEKCQKEKLDVGFLIIGEGPDKERYVEMINNLSNIKLLGAKKNPYKYLKNSDFLILTSKYEGYPVVYNEAIILNKPILTTLNITDDLIRIEDNLGIISSEEELFNNLQKIINFKPKKINFEEINKNRIESIERLIDKVYEEK